MALCGVCEPAPRSRLPRRFACTQPYRVFLGTPSSLAALAYPISLASFTACTLYSWSYCLFPAILSTLLILLIISQILENGVSSFFIPHQIIFGSKSAQKVSGLLKKYEIKKCLLVTGHHVVRHSITQNVIKALSVEGIHCDVCLRLQQYVVE